MKNYDQIWDYINLIALQEEKGRKFENNIKVLEFYHIEI